MRLNVMLEPDDDYELAYIQMRNKYDQLDEELEALRAENEVIPALRQRIERQQGVIHRLEAENEALKKMQWISVDDRLPLADVPCLIYPNNGYETSTYITHLRKFAVTHLYGAKVTHWMPLPQPPSQAAKE